MTSSGYEPATFRLVAYIVPKPTTVQFQLENPGQIIRDVKLNKKGTFNRSVTALTAFCTIRRCWYVHGFLLAGNLTNL
jgi:hypothetical protein